MRNKIVFVVIVLAFSLLVAAAPRTIKVVDAFTDQPVAGMKILIKKDIAPPAEPTVIATVTTDASGVAQYECTEDKPGQCCQCSGDVEQDEARRLSYYRYVDRQALQFEQATFRAIPEYKIKLFFPESGSFLSGIDFTKGCRQHVDTLTYAGRPFAKETNIVIQFNEYFTTPKPLRCGLSAVDLVSQKGGFVEFDYSKLSRHYINTFNVALDKTLQQTQDEHSRVSEVALENPSFYRRGWNLAPLILKPTPGLSGQSDCIDLNVLKLGLFFIDPRTNKYLNAQEFEASKDDPGFSQAVVKKGYYMAWVYSPFDCKRPVPGDWLEALELSPGWNVIPAFRAMPGGFGALATQGRTLDEFKNDCTIEKAFYWHGQSQKWENLAGYKFAGGEQALAIKVAGACSLKAASTTGPPPIPS